MLKITMLGVLLEGTVIQPCPGKMDIPHLMIRDFDRLLYPYEEIHCVSKTITWMSGV